MRAAIERYLRAFAAGIRCDVLDAVIDTTGVGARAIPMLSLWAFDVHPGDDFDAALAKGRAHDDAGFLEDVLVEVRSESPGLSLKDFFPKWPDDADEKTRELAAILTDLAASNPPELAGVARFVLRFANALDVRELR